MKKHYIIASIVFVVFVGLALASNFIHWDETPLEQTIWALPLAFGLLIQMPVLPFVAALFGKNEFMGNDLIWEVSPIVAGLLYSGLYLLICKQFFKTKQS